LQRFRLLHERLSSGATLGGCETRFKDDRMYFSTVVARSVAMCAGQRTRGRIPMNSTKDAFWRRFAPS
jgi:hypothetical protein